MIHISNFVSRINNGIRINRPNIEVKYSKEIHEILFLLYREGFLTYSLKGKIFFVTPRFKFHIFILSTSTRSRFTTYEKLHNKNRGASFEILRTTNGLLSSPSASSLHLGGEIVLQFKNFSI